MKNFETDLRAFHGDLAIKEKYLKRVKWHQEQDNIIKGTYSREYDTGIFKGCAVGCTLDFQENDKMSWHQRYEEEIGIPRLIARLEDGIFEGLPDQRSTGWPYEFLEAIKPGANLSYIWPKFALWLLIDEKYGVINYAKNENSRKSIRDVAEQYIRHDQVSQEDWEQVRAAARDAVDDARAAADDAATDGAGDIAYDIAYDIAQAAYAAARAAAYVAISTVTTRAADYTADFATSAAADAAADVAATSAAARAARVAAAYVAISTATDTAYDTAQAAARADTYAARAVARDAAYTARDVARQIVRIAQADKLLELLREAT